MAITVPNRNALECISLREYVEWVHQNVDTRDDASMVESAPQLAALNKNRGLLIDVVNASLRSAGTALQGADENPYIDTSFILYNSVADTAHRRRQCPFIVRAVVWRPMREWDGSKDRDEAVYFPHRAHDHNFRFLTIGYFGPGYETRIYEYDREKVEGFVGEHVELRTLEETTLAEGKIMFYRKGVDVHEQSAPASLSISLNLLSRGYARTDTQQYLFDINKSCISGYSEGALNQAVKLLDLAAELGDGNTAEYVKSIAQRSPRPRTRAAAFKALIHLVPSEYRRVRAAMTADRSAVVRQQVDAVKADMAGVLQARNTEA